VDKSEIEELRQMIARHGDYTKSTRAWKVLAEWESSVAKFVKVMPKDYKRALESLQRAKDAGLSGEDAINVAFEDNARDVARVGGN
jgi:glutamate synthase (ferredoxin)